MSIKIVSGIFQTGKDAFLNIWKRVWAKKLFQFFSDSQVCFFKYLKKGINKKIVPVIFRLVSMLFQIFEKGSEQKTCSSCFSDL